MASETSQLVAVLKATTVTQLQEQIKQAALADVWELRLDYFLTIDIPTVGEFLQQATKPVILTLRRDNQGGQFPASKETDRLNQLKELLAYSPAYIDLEFDTDLSFLQLIKTDFSQTKIISSIHDFSGTPDDLTRLIDQVNTPFTDYQKIVTFAKTSIDALRVLIFAKQQGPQVTAFCMGEAGLATRALSHVVGNAFCYAAITTKQQVVDSQLTLNELLTTYHYRSVDTNAAIYGLIGNPVSHSYGDLFHNRCFQHYGIAAIYVKFPLQAQDVNYFLELAKALPIAGLSVTMPLKQSIALFGTEPVNTIKITDDKITAINTDGLGGMNALAYHTELSGKKILILGAGGAATALANEAHNRGALISVANRNIQRAAVLANHVDGLWMGLDKELSQQEVDIVINTLPLVAYSDDRLLDYLIPVLAHQPIVMDIIYEPKETPLLAEAAQQGCFCVYGKAMFEQQAALQQEFWLSEE